jgi:starvation-inducible outer membrane lipoprotein
MIIRKQRINRWYYLIAILFSLYFSSCQTPPDSIDRQINTQIQQGHKEIKIAEITNFTWTKMYIFTPYTPAAFVIVIRPP